MGPFEESFGELPDDEQSAFEDLVDGFGSTMPPAEAEARAYLGDEAYAKIMAFNETSNALQIATVCAQIDDLKAQTAKRHAQREFVEAATTVVKFGTLVGIGWVLSRIFD